MKYTEFETLFRDLPTFNLATIQLMTGEGGPNLLNTLARWKREGRIIPLRRGVYTLPFSLNPPAPAMIANEIYRPSYLSLEWALSYYGLIPDVVYGYTSVTPRLGKTFSNTLGDFFYRHIKPDFFCGFEQRKIGSFKIWLAVPEKALLDYWHLNSGEWTASRLKAMRFQQTESIALSTLHSLVAKWPSPRLKRAVKAWLEYVQ